VLLTGDGLTAEGIAAAAVKFRLRLRRRAVTTAGVAAVGMVAGKAIEYQVACARRIAC
jgi:hypothetical protein